jgi:hypothetical protein
MSRPVVMLNRMVAAVTRRSSCCFCLLIRFRKDPAFVDVWSSRQGQSQTHPQCRIARQVARTSCPRRECIRRLNRKTASNLLAAKRDKKMVRRFAEVGQDQAMCWWDGVDGRWRHDASRWVHERGLEEEVGPGQSRCRHVYGPSA